MSKPLKNMMTEVLRKRYEGIDSACVVELTGLDVISTSKLRRELKSSNMRLEVVKNSLARRAFADGPLAALGNRLLGPCALVTGPASVVDIAKRLVDLTKEFKQLKLREGLIEGETATIDVLSKMKGRRELIGEVAMLMSSPGRRLAGCLNAPASKIAGCLKAMADKEGSEITTATAEAAAA